MLYLDEYLDQIKPEALETLRISMERLAGQLRQKVAQLGLSLYFSQKPGPRAQELAYALYDLSLQTDELGIQGSQLSLGNIATLDGVFDPRSKAEIHENCSGQHEANVYQRPLQNLRDADYRILGELCRSGRLNSAQVCGVLTAHAATNGFLTPKATRPPLVLLQGGHVSRHLLAGPPGP